MTKKHYDGALILYKKARIAFIGSQDNDGYPNIKAVSVVDKKADMRAIIIKTNTSSRHVQQYRENPKGCLYFLSLFDFKGVMLKGTFTVDENPETKRKYWKKGDEKYYSKGDDDYCLLVFRPNTGLYGHRYVSWDFEIN